MRHVLKQDERTFLAVYINNISKRASADKKSKKMMYRLIGLLDSSSTYVELNNRELKFLTNMCNGGVDLGKQRMAQLEKAPWYSKIRYFMARRNIRKSLERMIAGHENLVYKLKMEKRIATK